jgi:hypothetical protein
MSSQEIDRILQRYLKDECTPDEKELVEEWFEGIGKEKVDLDHNTRHVIQKRLWSALNATEPKRFGYGKFSRIAAAILLLVTSTFLLYKQFSPIVAVDHANVDAIKMQVVEAALAEKSVELNDGSVVMLQPGSEIRFPSVFQSKREVYLSGEAHFKVARDVNRPFLVYANEVTTRVLGTSFVVKAYAMEKDITVIVKTGKVSVYAKQASNNKDKQREIILTPNQQIIYHRNENQTVKMLVDDPQVIAHQPLQKANYTNVPVAEIFHTLEERYGIQIQYDTNALSGCTLTYADLTEEDLYGQIEIICNALGARYKKSESSIVIDSEGCKCKIISTP